MSDPLLDLLDEMGRAHEEYWDDQILNYQLPFNDHEAKWLREHRDRVIRLLYADDRDAALRNLDGLRIGSSGGEHIIWLFPEEA